MTLTNTLTQLCDSSYNGKPYYKMSLWSRVKQTDVANNRSLVEIAICMKKITDIPDDWESVSGTSYQKLWVDGTQVATASTGFNFKPDPVNTVKTLLTHEKWITHSTDGSKSITIKGEHNTTLNSLGTEILEIAVILPSIARASTFALGSSSLFMNGTDQQTVTISRESTSFTHKLTFECGTYKTVVNSVGTSHNFTIPKEWNNAVTSSTQGTASVTMQTYNGTTAIGESIRKTFEVKVPTNLVPSISTFTASRVNGDVPSTWGVYVQGKSNVTLSINSPTGSYGSRITAYKITGSGQNFYTQTATTKNLLTSGTVEFTATITDSRGRTANKTVSIYVYPYSPPVFTTGTTAYRSNASKVADSNGTYVTAKANVSYQNVGTKNPLVVKINNVVVSNNTEKLISNVSTETSYTVTMTASDQFSTVTKTYSIPTAVVPIDVHSSGKGVAIGKVAESANLFDVGLDARFRGDVTIDGTLNRRCLSGSDAQGGGTGGSNGHMLVARITQLNTYANTPIVFDVVQRSGKYHKVILLLNSVGSIESTSIYSLTDYVFLGYAPTVSAIKSSSNTYDLYVKKETTYDTVCISKHIYRNDYFSIDWMMEMVSTLPTGCTTATVININA